MSRSVRCIKHLLESLKVFGEKKYSSWCSKNRWEHFLLAPSRLGNMIFLHLFFPLKYRKLTFHEVLKCTKTDNRTWKKDGTLNDLCNTICGCFKGHSVNVLTIDHVTPLHEACVGDHVACARALIDAGANVSRTTACSVWNISWAIKIFWGVLRRVFVGVCLPCSSQIKPTYYLRGITKPMITPRKEDETFSQQWNKMFI